MLQLFSTFYATFFAWMPPLLSVMFFAYLALMALIIVFKLVAFLWDILPIA